jgi:hypothetical protein
MKISNKLVVFAILLFIFAGYMTIAEEVLVEMNQVNLHIQEIPDNEFDYIIISGFIRTSSYYYKKTDIKRDNLNMNIQIYAEPSVLNRNGSQSFINKFKIEKYINRICFGNSNIIIWERKSIETLLQREKLLELKKHTKYNDIVEQFGEPDAFVGSLFLIIQYILPNNRRAILNFGTGRDGLLQLSEVFGSDDNNENIIFGF